MWTRAAKKSAVDSVDSVTDNNLMSKATESRPTCRVGVDANCQLETFL